MPLVDVKALEIVRETLNIYRAENPAFPTTNSTDTGFCTYPYSYGDAIHRRVAS